LNVRAAGSVQLQLWKISRVNSHSSLITNTGIVLVVFSLLSVVSACKKSSVKLYPVKGKVLFKGQPAEGAQVVLRPANESDAGGSKTDSAPPNPYGDVKADGTFTLRTEPIGEGAPAGDYVGMISW